MCRSIIVAPNSEVLIPVSCVEQGRWNYESSVFRKGHAAYTDLKRKVMEDVCHSSDLGQGYASDQSRVWNDIQEKESFFNKTNLLQLFQHKEVDIRDIQSLFTVERSFKPDLLIHMAAQPLVLKSYEDPIETFSTVLYPYLRACNEALIKIISIKAITIPRPTRTHMLAIKLGPSRSGSENPPNNRITPIINNAPPMSPAMPNPLTCTSI